MKCPKCGYNSFEYNDTCIKCSNDLTSFKVSHNLKAIVLPLHARAAMAEELKAVEQADSQAKETTDTSSDMFSFNLSDSNPVNPASTSNPFDFGDDTFNSKPKAFDDFNFDEPKDTQKPASQEADFSNLLEQTAHNNEAPQAKPSGSAAGASKPEEFNLNDFSWDDAPATTKSGEPKKPSDDFSSLFGDAEKNSSGSAGALAKNN